MDTINLLKEIIKYDSSTRDGANTLLLYCRNWLLDNGLTCRIIENNQYKSLICTIGKGTKTLILNGHLDVVPANKGAFQPVIEGNRLYGRGSADMKAGAAAMMCAIVELKNENIPCKLMLQLVTDEEPSGENCSGFLVKSGYKGDFVICGEPTQLNIGVQAKGILQLDLEFHGVSAHGSRPWEGKNAIIKAYNEYNKILDLPFVNEKSLIYDGPSINLAMINGGEIYNKVPDYCKMSLDIRYLPGQSPEEIISQIKNALDCDIKVSSTGNAVNTDINSPYVTSLKNAATIVTGKQCILFGQHGSADTRFFSVCGIPAVEFGPSGKNWHGNNEYVLIDSVENYKNILKEFIKTFN